MKNSFPLSKMDCYAGKQLVEVSDFSPDIHDEPGMYLQFVEGCGYTVYEITPDEAEKLAALLLAKAKETRKNFKK